MVRQTEGADCVTFRANVVGNDASQLTVARTGCGMQYSSQYRSLNCTVIPSTADQLLRAHS